jgi:hypothetical protein
MKSGGIPEQAMTSSRWMLVDEASLHAEPSFDGAIHGTAVLASVEQVLTPTLSPVDMFEGLTPLVATVPSQRVCSPKTSA